MPVCLTICGESVTLPEGITTLEALLKHLNHNPAEGIAVAHQGIVIPRARWSEPLLNPGDTVEIVRPVFGG